jgi:hypothetical protein
MEKKLIYYVTLEKIIVIILPRKKELNQMLNFNQHNVFSMERIIERLIQQLNL